MFKVVVPATSANCCVGFDTLGMAVDIYATFTFEESDTFLITGCPLRYAGKDNLVYEAFCRTCEIIKKEVPPIHLHIESTIPFARGLGSSSACVVAGIMGAITWHNVEMSKMDILKIGIEMEGHPDNVAPAIFGSGCATFMDGDEPRMMMVPCHEYYGLAMIPPYPVKTEEARKLLPDTIAYKDACKQVAHALTFIQALYVGNQEVLTSACVDYLHEPYRKKLIQEYDAIHEYSVMHEFPMWISGSGSTMLALSLKKKDIDNLSRFIQTNYPYIECRNITVSKKGAFIEYE